jgi:hypothetical protein
MKKLLTIMLVGLMLVVAAQASKEVALSAVSSAKLVNTLDIFATENITVILQHSWTDKLENTSKLKLDPNKKYMIILVEVDEKE